MFYICFYKPKNFALMQYIKGLSQKYKRCLHHISGSHFEAKSCNEIKRTFKICCEKVKKSFAEVLYVIVFCQLYH